MPLAHRASAGITGGFQLFLPFGDYLVLIGYRNGLGGRKLALVLCKGAASSQEMRQMGTSIAMTLTYGLL